jgi:hypothetical protein
MQISLSWLFWNGVGVSKVALLNELLAMRKHIMISTWLAVLGCNEMITECYLLFPLDLPLSTEWLQILALYSKL